MESRDLTLLLTLDALLQEAHVTAAARRLGLSAAATSHALARIRERLGDPILVRAGRRMVRTPRGEQLRPLVRTLVEDATRVLSAAVPFSPRALTRSFTVFTTDHVLLVLGPVIDRILRDEAPGVSLRFLPSIVEDWIPLRDGVADLSVCILGHFPPEFRTRRLFTDRFVCVARKDHPGLGRRMTLDRYLALDHIVVSPLGLPSAVDRILAERTLERRVRRVVPFFMTGLWMAATSDAVLTVSDRAAAALAPTLGLRVVDPPLPLPAYALHLLWHPRVENDPASQWLRDVFVRAAREAAPDDAPDRAPVAAARTPSRRRSR